MILVVAEHHAGQVNRASLEAIAAAQQLDGPITVVLPGSGVAALASSLTQADVSAVVALEHDALTNYTPDGYVSALAAFARTLAFLRIIMAEAERVA